MSDPDTGLQCPISAVTIHPQTGVAYPVAGTHTDPVTGLPVAIELGSMMIDPSSEQPVPVLAVAIDPEEGKIFVSPALAGKTLRYRFVHCCCMLYVVVVVKTG